MANVIKKAVNKFTKGLIMDFSPENTQDEMLTNALNATLLTFNGNELSLQNDMGNARVETAYLPEGYIPVGTCEYGGIIYIVSYNPLEDKSQIGCFPSPERNISNDELGLSDKRLRSDDFQEFHDIQIGDMTKSVPSGKIEHTSYCVTLRNDNLNPGDKFIVTSDPNMYKESLLDLLVKQNESEDFTFVNNPMVALNIVSIEDSGKINYLNSSLLQYTHSETNESETTSYKYHILGTDKKGTTITPEDVDSYRSTVSSGYSVFKSKTSGKLAILAELVTIDSYSVTHSIEPQQGKDDCFDVMIHTEVGSSIKSIYSDLSDIQKFNLTPKLKYYYLEQSQGYVPVSANIQDTDIRKGDVYERPLFITNSDGAVEKNSYISSTLLSDIYTASTSQNNDQESESVNYEELDLTKSLGETCKLNFPKPGTYHSRMESYTGEELTDDVYSKFSKGFYHRILKTQVYEQSAYGTDSRYIHFIRDLEASFYRYNGNAEPSLVPSGTTLDEFKNYQIRVSTKKYIDVERNPNYKDLILYKVKDGVPQNTYRNPQIIQDKYIDKFIEIPMLGYEYIPNQEKLDKAIEDRLQILQLEGSNLIGYTKTYWVENLYIQEERQVLINIGPDININDYNDTVIIYYLATSDAYEEASPEEKALYYNEDLYPLDDSDTKGAPFVLYRFDEGEPKYEDATSSDKANFYKGTQELYEYVTYEKIENIANITDSTIFVTVPKDTYVSSKYFIPDTDHNFLKRGNDYTEVEVYIDEGPIELCTVADYVPEHKDDLSIEYPDVKLGDIKIPNILAENGCDFLFTYNYKLVPCMSYGKLDWLSVENTINFSKLHNFRLSTFNTWKYRIDGNQLRLTFGAEVYDTFQDDKVDALILEFYDLRGFAGSLSITGKKSYTGFFTQFLTLNNHGTLSTKRVQNGEYMSQDNFVRNVNIAYNKDDQNYYYNDKQTKYDTNVGWTNLEKSDNDLGVLYSNMIYGVKTYFRLKNKNTGEYKFEPKENFFLYTLPIYNGYYSSFSNFNRLGNPKLDLALTYRLEDLSSIIPYESDTIQDGYPSQYTATVNKYISGSASDVGHLNFIRYYNYVGQSKLYLEIGFPEKTYESFNLGYDPQINDYFTCDLELLSNDVDSKYTFSTDDKTLHYSYENEQYVDKDVNYITFTDNQASISLENFREYNFINVSDSVTQKYIPINYSFVVGYPVTISNIHLTTIPATTICSLCHKRQDGTYNYEDFGIYQQNGEFLSNVMFYNGGTSDSEIFGVCQQVKTTGNMLQQCRSYTSIQKTASLIDAEGLLNVDSLKQLQSYVGPLTFCQPHAHGFSLENGVNVYKDDYGYYIGPEVDKKDTSGIVPSLDLYNNPIYNLTLNTINSMQYQGEFISTNNYKLREDVSIPTGDGDTATVTARRFTGLTGEELQIFNKKLINTMKKVYAYNPEYDSLQIYKGDVGIIDLNSKFISNLLCKNASLGDNFNFNKYIYLGSISIEQYLKDLSEFANWATNYQLQVFSNDGSPVPQVKFIPNIMYCGGEKNKTLISTLTYNLQSPETLRKELSFDRPDQFFVKHSEGDHSLLIGKPNKNILYGFKNDPDQLIQLDVSNYKINIDGSLEISTEQREFIYTHEYAIQPATTDGYNYGFIDGDVDKLIDGGLPITFTVDGKAFTCNVTLNTDQATVLGQDYYNGSSFSENDYTSFVTSTDWDRMLYFTKPSQNSDNKITINFNVTVTSDSENVSDYDVEVSSIILDLDNPPKGYLYYKDNKYTSELEKKPKYILQDLFCNTTTKAEYANALFDELDTQEFFISGEQYEQGDASIYTPFEMGVIHTGNLDISTVKQASLLIGFSLQTIKLSVYKKKHTDIPSGDIVYVQPTTDYYDTKPYNVKQNYVPQCIKGTSLTLNDLVYINNPNGHRLFVRNGCTTYNGEVRNKIYYRIMNKDKGIHESWKYENTKYLNSLYIYDGPSFITTNLGIDT